MEYAVYVYDVQHIILDNLQFMMSGVAGKVRRQQSPNQSTNQSINQSINQ